MRYCLQVTALVFSVGAEAFAVQSNIQNIYSSNTVTSVGGAFLNNHGAVAFTENYSLGSTAFAADLWKDGGLSRVYTLARPSQGGLSYSIGLTDLNDFDQSVILAKVNGGPQQVLRVLPGSSEVVAQTSANAYKSFTSALLDGTGGVLFDAQLQSGVRGIFRGGDPATDTLLDDSGSIKFPGLLQIRGDGKPIIRGFLNGASSIFVGPNPDSDLYINFGPFNSPFNNPNGLYSSTADLFVFNSFLADGTRGIFNGLNPNQNRVVDTLGSFNDLGRCFINRGGLVAFEGSLDDGRTGLFVGPDVNTDAIIRTGDSLFGSTVTAVSIGELNDHNQLTLTYTLANGFKGVALADVIVPEPASALAAIMLCATPLRRSSKKPSMV